MQDISRTKPDGASGLFRFNMPFERGLFAGAVRFGAPDRRRKVCLVLDRERHRFQTFLVDIASQDIREHGTWRALGAAEGAACHPSCVPKQSSGHSR